MLDVRCSMFDASCSQDNPSYETIQQDTAPTNATCLKHKLLEEAYTIMNKLDILTYPDKTLSRPTTLLDNIDGKVQQDDR